MTKRAHFRMASEEEICDIRPKALDYIPSSFINDTIDVISSSNHRVNLSLKSGDCPAHFKKTVALEKITLNSLP